MTNSDKTIAFSLIAWIALSMYGTFRGVEWMMTVNSLVLIVILGMVVVFLYNEEK
jgi:hypothetical protein